VVSARKKVPERERVARSRAVEQCVERGTVAREVVPCERGDVSVRRVLEEARARPRARLREAGRARGDNRLARAVFECDVTCGDVQEAAPRVVNFERVSATQIRGDSRGRVDEEEAGRGPDARVQSATREFEAVLAHVSGDQADARVRVNLDLADVGDGDLGARGGVRLKPLADGETPAVADLVRVNARRAF